MVRKNKETGRKDFEGKLPYELLSINAIEGYVKVLAYGAKKYAVENWKKITTPILFYAAALRHMMAVAKGEWLDKESNLPHLDHAVCSLIMWRELIKGNYEDSKMLTPYSVSKKLKINETN